MEPFHFFMNYIPKPGNVKSKVFKNRIEEINQGNQDSKENILESLH